jgi:hypothetical protein
MIARVTARMGATIARNAAAMRAALQAPTFQETHYAPRSGLGLGAALFSTINHKIVISLYSKVYYRSISFLWFAALL